MKALLLYLLLFLFGISAYAQESGYYGLQSTYTFTGDTYYPTAGISIEGLFGDHFSISFSALYSPVDSDTYYFSTGGGQALGVYLIKKGFENTKDLPYALPLGLMSFIIPESVAYRIPVTARSQLAIYLTPFTYEVFRNTTENFSDERGSYELGMRYYLAANHWIYIVPRVGMKGYYGDRALGLTYGLSIMLKGKKKEPKEK